jgi:hypothetical protein
MFNEDSEIPLDWAEDVLPERCTEEEMDREMTTIFWSWDGPEDGEDATYQDMEE